MFLPALASRTVEVRRRKLLGFTSESHRVDRSPLFRLGSLLFGGVAETFSLSIHMYEYISSLCSVCICRDIDYMISLTLPSFQLLPHLRKRVCGVRTAVGALAFTPLLRKVIVDSKKLEYGFGVIPAGFPFLYCFGIR